MKRTTGMLYLVLAAMLLPLNVFAAGAIITNGTIQMGVNDSGDLNTPYPGDPAGIGAMGLRYVNRSEYISGRVSV